MRWVVYTILLLLTNQAISQQLPLETYTPANGLVDSRVNKVFQDSKGRIYFLTREGFSIFDGQRFSNYANEAYKRTEITTGIAEYSDGTVRVFSFDGNIYEVNNNNVSIDTSQRKLLSEVNTVIDLNADEKIIATNHHLLLEKKKQLRKINIPYRFEKVPRIDNIFRAGPYLVMVRSLPAAGNMLYLYHLQKQVLLDSLHTGSITISIADKKENIFLLARSWLQLDKTELSKGKLRLQHAWFHDRIPAAFKTAAINFDNNNDLWLVSSEGGYCKPAFDQKEHTLFTVSEGVLAGAKILFQDAENNYWFISSSNGIQKMQQSPLAKVNSFKNIPSGYVSSINKDEAGNIAVYSNSGMFLNHEKIRDFDPSIKYNPYYFHGQTWWFTDHKTLVSSKGVRINIEDHIKDYTAVDLSPAFTSVDRDGRFIISGSVIFIIDRSLQLHAYRPPYFCDNVVVDEKNNYWCFSRSNDVVKLSWINGRLQEVYRSYVPELNPRFVLQWNSNTFIAGTRFEGLKFFSYRNGKLNYVSNLTKKDGLSNNFIYSLLKKNDSQLLAGTGTGLVMITMSASDTIIENLSLRNNVFPPFTNLLAAKDSSSYCHTGSGSLYLLQKDTRLSSGYQPTAWFRSVIVNGEMINAERSFSHNRNNFSFSISAPSFLDNKNMRFNFLLQGEGIQWQQQSGSADYQINNLPPGNYTLIATVQYPGRYYPDKQLQYSFSIKKPYWKQWWFIALSFVWITAVIYLLIRNYFSRQLARQRLIVEKQQAVEAERSRIAADMHDDLGSGLTKIRYLTQMAMAKKNVETDLQSIKRTSGELIENMSEIIWAMKEENNSLEDLLYYIKMYAVEYCGENGLECNVQFPEKIPAGNVTGQNRRNIYLACKEVLHNIVKHADAKKVKIMATFENGLLLKISDDGKGIDLQQSISLYGLGGNGLKNIGRRINAVKGEMEISNNAGTEVVFHIPL